MNFDRVGAALAGITTIAAGGGIILSPRWIDPVFQAPIDFTGFNFPFGAAMIIAGTLFVWFGAIKPKEVNLICPTCEELFRWTESLGEKCPKCGADLEPFEDFYKRHPELRTKKRQKDKL